MIDYNDAENALNFLKNTDVEFARAKCLYEGLEDQKKTIEACCFMNASGSAAERTQKAKQDEAYCKHLDKIDAARIDYETLRNKRASAVLQIDMWRSVNSNQRKGNV